MATAEVDIVYRSSAEGLKATVDVFTKANNEIEEGTKKVAKTATDNLKKIGESLPAAFGSAQVKAALDQLNKESAKLTSGLRKLQEEQVELISSGNRVSKAFKDNAAAQAALKGQIAEITAQQKQLNDTFVQSEDKQKSLTGQLRQLKQELSLLEQAGKDNGEEFEKLTFQAAKLEDQIGDTRERVRVLASDTFKFDAAVGAVSTLASGFEAAQGAAALFGGESEQLNEIIAKTTAVTALANGVREIANTLTGQSAVKLAVLSAAQRIYTTVVGTSTGALKGFRLALAATGIGALVIALGTAIAYWDDIKGAITGVNSEQEKLNQSTKDNLQDLDEQLKLIELQENTLKLQGATQEDIIKKKQIVLQQSIKQAEIDIANAENTSKALIANEQLALDIIKGISRVSLEVFALTFRAIALPIDAAILLYNEFAKIVGSDTITSTLNEQITNLTSAGADLYGDALSIIGFDPEATKAEGDKTIKEAKQKLAELKSANDGYTLDLKNIEKERKDNAEAAAKEANDKAKELSEKALEDQKAAREALAAAELAAFVATLDAQDKIRNEANDKIAQLEQNFIDSKFQKGTEEEKKLQTAIAQIKEDAAKQIAELDKKDLEDRLQRDLEALKASADATFQQQIDALAAQRDRELKDAEALGKDKAEIALKYNNQINDLNKQLIESEFNTREANLKRLEIIEGSSLDRRIALIELEAERRRKAAEDTIVDAKQRAAQIELINAETQAAIRAERQKTDSEAIDGALKVAQEVGDLFIGLADLQSAASEQRITEIQESSQAELDNINKGLESEIDKQRQREALEKRTNAKIAAEKLKQAKLDRGIAIFDVIIKTAQAVNTAVAASPLTFGLPWSAFAAASGAIQLAAIQAQPLPKFKKGGIVGGRSHEAGGTIIEAEKGEFVVNKQSATRHRDALDAMNRSSDAFKKYIDQRYVRPALLDFAAKKDRGVQVNATLNAKGVEKKLDKLTKVVSKQKTTININGTDNRYQWQ
jgi:PAS domain-containing protein